MSKDLGTAQLLEAMSQPKPETTKVVDILNSVLKGSTSNTIIREVSVAKKIKVKHNALRDSVLTFRDLTLHFDVNGVAETEEYNKPIIEIEQMYRPGCFTFLEEEKIEEDITIDQFLEKARKELEEDLEGTPESEKIDETKDLENKTEEVINKEQSHPTRKGRKEKVK